MPDLMSAALLEDGDAVLSAHRKGSKRPFANQWLLPMTVVRSEETAEEALRRHLRDQFGVASSGESFVAMQARMVATLDGYRRRHPGRTIVAVSHADPIRALVAHAMGTHLDLFQRVVVSPCSLTAIALGDAGPIVLTVNATGDPGPLVPS